MDISDYIPNYPEKGNYPDINPNFNNAIFHKKEFYELANKLPITTNIPGDLFPHQQAIARFLNPHTSYDRLLLFHAVGTGKTCAASAVVEINKQDPLVRKPVLIIVPNENIETQWRMMIAEKCTTGEYLPADYEKLSRLEKVHRLKKLSKHDYKFMTLEKMSKWISKRVIEGNTEKIKKKYSNTIIIIDEAHNLHIQPLKKSKNIDEDAELSEDPKKETDEWLDKLEKQEKEARKKEPTTRLETIKEGLKKEVKKVERSADDPHQRYADMHLFLHLIVGSKVVLLTATPMYDNIEQLPEIMNLLLPLDQQLPSGVEFRNKYVQVDPNTGDHNIKNEEDLMSRLTGYVSYVRGGGNFPVRIDEGTLDWTNHIKIVSVQMSDLQVEGYLAAYERDKHPGQGRAGLSVNTRQAINFVYGGDNGYLWGKEAFDLLAKETAKTTVTFGERKIGISHVVIKGKYRDQVRENLSLYSNKYQTIVNFCLDRETDPIFIFNAAVSGAGGCLFLGAIFQLFGYSEAIGIEQSPGRRFAIITGDTPAIRRRALISLFNSEKNTSGQYIQVLIGSKAIAEGTNFINVRHEIIVSPWWNNSGTEQAIGRGIRVNSLLKVPDNDRAVTVLQMASVSENLTNDENIDIRMYRISEWKDTEIRTAERILKRAAWDCALNYANNVHEKDINGSRLCDYQACNYECYGVEPTSKTPPKWIYSVPEEELDIDTFLLYYAKSDLARAAVKIAQALQIKNHIDINAYIYDMVPNDKKMALSTIEYMINNNTPVSNRWGQACFLCKDHNMLFLSQIPDETQFINSWYTSFPFANQRIPLGSVINEQIFNRDLEKLQTLDLKSPTAKDVIRSLDTDTQIFILEYLYMLNPATMDERQQTLFNTFKELFKYNVKRIPDQDTLAHNLTKTSLNTEYNDFTQGNKGKIRCLHAGANEWVDCKKKEEDKVSSVFSQEFKAKAEQEVRERGGKLADSIYGIVEQNGDFKIVDKAAEKRTARSRTAAEGTDERTLFKGRVCPKSLKFETIIPYFFSIGYVAPATVNTNSVTAMKAFVIGKKKPLPHPETLQNYRNLCAQIMQDTIKTKKLEKYLPESPTLDDYNRLFFFTTHTNKELCKILKQEFEKKGILIYK